MVNVIATSLDFEPSYLLIAPPPTSFPIVLIVMPRFKNPPSVNRFSAGKSAKVTIYIYIYRL